LRKGRVIVAVSVVVCVAAIVALVYAGLHRTKHATRAVPTPPRRHQRHRRTRPHTHPLIVAGPHNGAVPILMYHVISSPPRQAPFPDLYVPAREFADQMRWLARHGYHAVSLRRVYDYWHKGYALPGRPVVLTFDDGYLSDATRALPILRRYRWAGVLNLEVRHAEPHDLPVWRIRQLISNGWEVDAHTITHPDLTTVDATRLRDEVAGSRARIRRMFHVPVDFFCYPSGRYDARVIAAVRKAGYLGATTANFALARPRDRYTLGRIRVNGSDGVRGFASKLLALRQY
jgi:peptidoglycan/xylan/chitin deacetylase (PgdA/CDA1 family)